MTSLSRFLLLLAVLVFAGCSTPSMSPPAPAPTPVPPAPVIELPPAQLTGSEEKSTMLDNFTAFVVAVDGIPVAPGREGWNTPVTLKAGPHRLTLGFVRGVFSAETEVPFTAVSEAAYQVRFATDAQLFGKNSYCEFWIVDLATDQPACDRIRADLKRTAAK